MKTHLGLECKFAIKRRKNPVAKDLKFERFQIITRT
jgi:hypothetical protein